MQRNERGCDPNHKRLTLIEIEKPSDAWIGDDAYGPPRKHWSVGIPERIRRRGVRSDDAGHRP
jgi:hypothetical protein